MNLSKLNFNKTLASKAKAKGAGIVFDKEGKPKGDTKSFNEKNLKKDTK